MIIADLLFLVFIAYAWGYSGSESGRNGLLAFGLLIILNIIALTRAGVGIW